MNLSKGQMGDGPSSLLGALLTGELEPDVDQKRWSASLLWADEVAPGWKAAATAAWGRKSIKHHEDWWNDDAYVAEASLKPIE